MSPEKKRPWETLHSKRKTFAGFLVTVMVIGVITAITVVMQVGRLGDDGDAAQTVDPRLISATPVTVRFADKDPVVVQLVGDSISFGVGATRPESSWFLQMMKSLSANGPVVPLAAATPGATVQEQASRTTFEQPADLVVIELGTNDMGNEPGEGATDPDKLRASYRALVGAAQAESPAAGLLCLGVWTDPSSADVIDGIIRSECALAGGTFVPLATIFQNPDAHGPLGRSTYLGAGDEFHPNDTGAAEIAGAVLSHIDVRTDGEK